MTSPLRYPSPIHNSVERASEVVREGGYEIREVLNLLSLVLDLDRSLDIILVWNAFFYLSFFTSFHDHQSLRPLCNSSLPPEHQCVSHLWLSTHWSALQNFTYSKSYLIPEASHGTELHSIFRRRAWSRSYSQSCLLSMTPDGGPDARPLSSRRRCFSTPLIVTPLPPFSPSIWS